jgi:hypothetical protein
MQGITQTAASRLAEYKRSHPEFSICQVEGNHYAWKPAPGSDYDGEQLTGRTEDELLAKLTAALG